MTSGALLTILLISHQASTKVFFDEGGRGQVIMAGTYLGSGSIVLLGPEGTTYQSFDPAETKVQRGEPRKTAIADSYSDGGRFDPSPKALRNHISQCATAYVAGTLSPKRPNPAPELRKPVTRAGGNVAWLAADRTRRHLFHQMVCKNCGQSIPYGKIWAEN
jgi:hypothetical protein